MAQIEQSDQDLNPELLHTYADDKGHCPDTWERELGEWQFDGVDESGTTESDSTETSKRTHYCATKQPYLSPLHEELAKWLPAT